jgi:hypothetical protein
MTDIPSYVAIPVITVLIAVLVVVLIGIFNER